MMSQRTFTVSAEIDRPLVRQIIDDLRGRIDRGTLRHGEQLPSMRQLREESGVSVGIIRQAIQTLASDGYLRTDARRGVFVSRPDFKVSNVALVVPMMKVEGIDRVLHGLRQGFLGTSSRLVVEAADDSFESQVELLKRLDAAFVDGAIVMPPPMAEHAAALRELRAKGVPAVQLTLHLDELDTPAVVCDDFERGRLGMDLLLRAGHRRIGVVDNTADARSYQDLRRGMAQALRRVGLSLTDLPVAVADAAALDAARPTALGEQAARRLLETAPDVTAIVGMTANLTLGALHALRNHGRRIPGDVSLLSIHGDTQTLEHTDPPVTAIDSPMEQIAARAADVLDALMNNAEPFPQHVIQLPPIVKQRGSVAPPSL